MFDRYITEEKLITFFLFLSRPQYLQNTIKEEAKEKQQIVRGKNNWLGGMKFECNADMCI